MNGPKAPIDRWWDYVCRIRLPWINLTVVYSTQVSQDLITQWTINEAHKFCAVWLASLADHFKCYLVIPGFQTAVKPINNLNTLSFNTMNGSKCSLQLYTFLTELNGTYRWRSGLEATRSRFRSSHSNLGGLSLWGKIGGGNQYIEERQDRNLIHEIRKSPSLDLCGLKYSI